MTNEFKNRDMELWHSYNQTGDKKALSDLMQQLRPLIYKEVARTSGSLPTAALSAEAKKWAIKGIQTYDPTKGVALSTHVVNYLQKTRRLNYKYQNMTRLPENLQLQYHDYKTALDHLTNLHNREPSEEEMANHLGWSKAAVVRYKAGLREDLVESAQVRPTEFAQFDYGGLKMTNIMNNLSEEEKIIMHNLELPSTELAAKLNVNLNRLNYLKAKMKTKIEKLNQEFDRYHG